MKNGEQHPNIVRFYESGSFNVELDKENGNGERVHNEPIVVEDPAATTMHTTVVEATPKKKQ